MRGARRRLVRMVAIAGAASACMTSAAAAQQVRVTGATTVRYVDVHSLRVDSVPAGEVPGDGVLRRTVDGVPVQCDAGADFCRFYVAGGAASTVPASQDLWISAWGFGRGVRVYSHLRGRAVLGGGNTTLWPQANDTFDALEAYVELNRRLFRIRAGRQWLTSGLGLYNFDGAAAMLRPARWISIEGYGGRSLIRGLNEPITSDALAAVDDWVPGSRSILLAVQVRARPVAGATLSGIYQREIRRDRLGLFAERVALDGVWQASRMRLEASLDGDLAASAVNELRVAANLFPSPSVTVRGYVRRHRPYFELWTIWGAFSPVGYEEAGLGADWRPVDSPVRVGLQASRRRYPDTGAGLGFLPLRSSGWRVAGTASLEPAPRWSVDARYATELGFGAALNDGGVTVRRELGARTHAALGASAFQGGSELRFSDATVAGLDADVGTRLGERFQLDASFAAYRRVAGEPEAGVDWNQLRATLRLGWTVGSEPGLGRTAGGS